MLKKLVNLIWRGGVQEFKEPKHQLMTEDEFSKKSLIGEEEEYNDMSNLIEQFGENQEFEEVNEVFESLEEMQKKK
ncbi:hypothetical protein N9V12_02275 [Gammaproteobacteria bacterium]|nr:hypothetical protein [Gammaproteobacteria bacterium]MEC8448974.1 hypothetical protein [Pseudomonadota bacterium]MED5349409.1 hypothetical protein [Pseudomonadota bacterium]|tara:strand:+ start:64 stop:291 length:228 start_codon:yes stop_codon:yes gene_type:complete